MFKKLYYTLVDTATQSVTSQSHFPYRGRMGDGERRERKRGSEGDSII